VALVDADHADEFSASLLARYDYTDTAQVWICEPAAGATVHRL
jgi:galactokinase